ncbi:FdtA/QdtA family cupin domain-containing protein [Faecalicatena orotica]|uniref:WxcM-like protein n=1 Tax=Faecalicatena orotica TaxID=1544 RepID=A0A2Y9B8T8_9FIRM|nr:FdtA/QdtA family cupin domain-containing protein [Faecalicatena orotica]PWJ31991.1 WxcM-like protein [Faecalicatena orotica]SSA53819.1 WxcM-like, C-terminal [Faecalicatena orotica]
MQVIKYAFQQHGDSRGQLVALEEMKDIPFTIKRVYYMYDTGEGVRRGYHAHKSLEQILICIHGSCKIMLDSGFEKKVVSLEKPYEGLYISNNMWREMYDFSSDAVLLVLASELYDESDYIRDYEEFLKMVERGELDTNESNESR